VRGFGPALMPHSLERTQDISYDLPPADQRKGETGAESDRNLGNPTVTHQSTLIRYPAGTMAPPRQKNVAGMELGRGAHAVARIGPGLTRVSNRPILARSLTVDAFHVRDHHLGR
jgi:hypothetical protein